jgi:hypothetical protein
MSLHKLRLVTLALLTLVAFAGVGVWAGRPTATSSAPPGNLRVAAEEVKPPKGMPPRFMTVAKIDKDKIELVEVQAVEGRPDDSIESRRTARLKTLRGFDTRGKELGREIWQKRLKAGDVVVVATDDKKIDPRYLRVLKNDTVVLWGVRVLTPAPVAPK